MKLRIRENSLRLRLTISEVETFKDTGTVSDHIDLGVERSNRLTYTLTSSKQMEEIETGLAENRITVAVPEAIARHWIENDDVGIRNEQEMAGRGILSILVEKDFACLKKRVGEDDSGNFPHPEAMAAC